MPSIAVGEKLPSATLYENEPEIERDLLEIVANKRAIIFGIPGAFIPGCSKVHLWGFVQKSKELRSLGFHEIICISVNDPYILSAWCRLKGAGDKVKLLADPEANFTRAIGMDVEIPELGGVRSRRYSMVTINGIVRELYVDSPDVELVCLRKESIPTHCM